MGCLRAPCPKEIIECRELSPTQGRFGTFLGTAQCLRAREAFGGAGWFWLCASAGALRGALVSTFPDSPRSGPFPGLGAGITQPFWYKTAVIKAHLLRRSTKEEGKQQGLLAFIQQRTLPGGWPGREKGAIVPSPALRGRGAPAPATSPVGEKLKKKRCEKK